MSFLNLGERKTAVEWRMEEDGLMSWFRDEYDEIPITREEWRDGSHRPDGTKATPDTPKK